MRVHEFTVHSNIDRFELIQISNLASRFISQIVLSYVDKDEHEHIIDVKSLLGMIFQPIIPGTRLRLSTKGKDELEALEAMLEQFNKYNYK
ncbi:HPr family phosphocarrier protein [Paenibacillus polygoni]|uniref:HPr family phosphocarrier protein n=1 Tax=Paenibacillus polygoni TaxID=3050112 RepID=A0ABY8WXD7_9BACL|nr:HPr family phosphocarrier protein [Paenibacillus polygoni]WIV17706.1 HPr family phosphocarrier protein [Paenibacillus polygoni]